MPLQPIFETKGPPLIPADELDDPDTSFLVPCVHCEALLQEGELFCPSCGKDQRVAADTGDTTDKTDTTDASAAAQGVGWLGPRLADPLQPDADAAARTPTPVDGLPGSGARRPVAAIFGTLAVLLLIGLGVLLGVDHYSEKRVDAERLQGFDAAVTPQRVREQEAALQPEPQPPPPPLQKAPESATQTTEPAPPAATECNEALAAMSLCQPR